MSDPIEVPQEDLSVSIPKPEFREFLELPLASAQSLIQTMLEWRHKIIVRFYVATAAFATAAGVASTNSRLGYKVAASLLIVGSSVGVLACLMDRVNQRILYDQYDVTAHIETRLGLSSDLGPWKRMEERFGRRKPSEASSVFGRVKCHLYLSYQSILIVTYLGTAALMLASGLLVIAWK